MIESRESRLIALCLLLRVWGLQSAVGQVRQEYGHRDGDTDGDVLIAVQMAEVLAVNDPGGSGRSTALHWAVRHRSVAFVSLMLARHPQQVKLYWHNLHHNLACAHGQCHVA